MNSAYQLKRLSAIILFTALILFQSRSAQAIIPFAFLKSVFRNFTIDQKVADMTDPVVRAAAASEAYGYSVAVSADQSTIVIGAKGDALDSNGSNYAASAGSAYVYVKSGGNWTLQQKISASGANARTSGDFFGQSVSISGDTIVVGAPGQPYDASGANALTNAGAAYVFTRTTGVWSLQQKLVGTGTGGRTAGDRFGGSVAVSGDTAVIGAYAQDTDASGANSVTDAGAAFVFTRSGSTWSLQQKLVDTSTGGRVAGDNFGMSVALDTDTAVIGATAQDTDASGANSVTDAGAAYVFTRSAGAWSLQQKLVPTGTNARIASDNFGESVSISVDTVAVGSKNSYDDTGANLVSGAGAAFVFTRSGSTWTQEQKIIPTGTNARKSNDQFGLSVSVSADTLLAGSQNSYDASGANSASGAGAAFVFTRSAGTWTQQQKIVATGTNSRLASDGFGNSVALSGDTAVIGEPNGDYDANGATQAVDSGEAFVNERSGSVWSQTGRTADSIDPPVRGVSAGAHFGSSIAISGDESTMVVGAPNEALDASGANYQQNAGAAYVYVKSGATWTLQQKLIGTGTNGRMASDLFGTSVAISADTVVIGAPGQSWDASGANSVSGAGAAYVFTRSGGVWSLQQKLVGTGTAGRVASDDFGVSVGIDGDTVVVGADQQDTDDTGANSVTNAGAAFVFTRTTGVWSLQQKLVATGTNSRMSSDLFGTSVAISVDTVGVGAIGQGYDASGSTPLNVSAGAVFVFTRSGSTWSLQQKLVESGGANERVAGDKLGSSVALSGDVLVSGAPRQDYDASSANSLTDAGAAYIYARSGSTWSLQQKVTGMGTNGRMSSDKFGISVATDANTVVVGAYNHDYDSSGQNSVSNAGAAYIFQKTSNAWGFSQKIVESGVNGRLAQDDLGTGVAVIGKTLAAGANQQAYDSSGANIATNAGAVYLFSVKP